MKIPSAFSVVVFSAVAAALLSGCSSYYEEEPTYGSLYEKAAHQRQATAECPMVSPLNLDANDYRAPLSARTGAYSKVSVSSVRVRKPEKNPAHVDITGNRDSILFGAFEFTDY